MMTEEMKQNAWDILRGMLQPVSAWKSIAAQIFEAGMRYQVQQGRAGELTEQQYADGSRELHRNYGGPNSDRVRLSELKRILTDAAPTPKPQDVLPPASEPRDVGLNLSERAPRIYEERCAVCGGHMTSDAAFSCTPELCISKRTTPQTNSCGNAVSSTYGDLMLNYPRIAVMLEPHEWDNMNASEQRDWALWRMTVPQHTLAGFVLKSRLDRLSRADSERVTPDIQCFEYGDVGGPWCVVVNHDRYHPDSEYNLTERRAKLWAAALRAELEKEK